MPVFLLFFSKDLVDKIVMDTSHFTGQFMNSRG
jgi:allantoicase